MKDKLAKILYHGLPIFGYSFVGVSIILLVLIAPFDFWFWVFYLSFSLGGIFSIVGFVKLYFWAADKVNENKNQKILSVDQNGKQLCCGTRENKKEKIEN